MKYKLNLLSYKGVIKLHKGADGSWCSVELCDLVLFDHSPEPSSVRVERCALKLVEGKKWMETF